MMDKLISKFVDELKQRPSWCEDQVDNFVSVPHEEDDGKVLKNMYIEILENVFFIRDLYHPSFGSIYNQLLYQ